MIYWGPPKEEPPEPPEERFARLFKAAQVLLREGIAEEDVIYPTLAYANQLGLGIVVYGELGRVILDVDEEADTLVSSAEKNVGWEAAVERFSRRHSGLVPIKVVDGIVILRWLAVDGGVHFYPLPGAKIPEVVTVRIRPRTGSLESGLISRVYENILSAHEVSYGTFMVSSTDHEVVGNELFIRSYASTDTATRIPSEYAEAVFGDRAPEFAPPDFVEGYGRLLLGSGRKGKSGFDRWMNRRKSGMPPTNTPQRTANLIRVCVAYFLGNDGGLPEGVVAHRLLNKHVLPLPEDVAMLPEVGISTKESTALWRATKKAGERLNAAAWAIQDHHYTP